MKEAIIERTRTMLTNRFFILNTLPFVPNIYIFLFSDLPQRPGALQMFFKSSPARRKYIDILQNYNMPPVVFQAMFSNI